MNKMMKSKGVAWGGMFVMVVVTVVCMLMPGVKEHWWELTDVFAGFMMVFCHLAALYLENLNPEAGKRLDMIAMLFGILAIVAFFCIYFIAQ